MKNMNTKFFADVMLYVNTVTITVAMFATMPPVVIGGEFVKYVRDKEDVYCSSTGTTETTGRVLQCARRCQQDVTCRSFTGSDADQVCLLHPDAVTCTYMYGYNRYVQDPVSPTSTSPATWVTSSTSGSSTSSTGGSSSNSQQFPTTTLPQYGDYYISSEFLMIGYTKDAGVTTGYLRAKINGNWQDLCERGFSALTDADRDQICTILGLGSYSAPLYAYWNHGNYEAVAPYAVETLACASDFSTCDNVVYGAGGACNGRSFLYCSNQGSFYEAIQLADGVKPDEGRVELMVGGTWGTVCGSDITNHTGTIICQALGWADQCAVVTGGFPAGSGPVWFPHIECDLTASQLSECYIPYRSSCTPADALGLECC